MTVPQEVHRSIVSSVADNYRKEGYDVVDQPKPEIVPFDLNGFRPDLLARKGGESLIIEVRTRANSSSFERLRPLVEETKRHRGWHFVLVTDQDSLGFGIGDAEYTTPAWSFIAERVRHAHRLVETGEEEAAYLLLWIAFEQMMRSHAVHVDLPLDRLAPAVLIRQLYSDGELSLAQYDTALRCQKERNRIVHGFLATDVSRHREALENLVEALLADWSADRGETEARRI